MVSGELESRVAIVTGAARGIGLAVAGRLYSEGAVVFLADVSGREVERAAAGIDREGAGRALGQAIDVSKQESVTEAVRRCAGAFGRIDILVNNAGIVGRARIEEMGLETWDRIIAVNLTGVYLCCQAVLPYMKAAGGGVIVNASSVSAGMPDVGLSAYCISKAGVEMLTRVLAAEAAPYGIRVNGYAPGVTRTPMTEELIAERGEEKLRHIALNRFGDPANIAETVLFLCSSRSSFITGETVRVDGGTMIVEHPWKARLRGDEAK